MAIIGLPIEPSVILVPDNPDDVLPPGYVPDGILPGVTNPDGSIIVDEFDISVTGECVDHTDPVDPCTEYWCLDDGCPPGCQPIPEFPPIPSLPTNCDLVSVGTVSDGISGFIEISGSTDLIMHNSSGTSGFIKRVSADLLTTYWTTTKYSLGITVGSVTEFPKRPVLLSDGTLACTLSGTYANRSDCMVVRLDINTGLHITIKSFLSLGLEFTIIEGGAEEAMVEQQYGIILLAPQRGSIGGTSHLLYFIYDYINDLISYVDLGPSKVLNSHPMTLHVVGENVFIGAVHTQLSGGNYQLGEVYRTTTLHDGEISLFDQGSVHFSDPYFNDGFGYEMYSDDKYFIIKSGNSYANNNMGSWGDSALHIYDVNTFTFIKRIRDPFAIDGAEPDAEWYYSSGFGKGLIRFGNYYYVGMPNEYWMNNRITEPSTDEATGKIYVYDLDFNFFHEFTSFPLPNPGSLFGMSIFNNGINFYSGDYTLGNTGLKNVKVCKV